MKRFIGVDGEAYKNGNYVLLASSTREYVYEANELSTETCLQFLISEGKKGTLIGFGFNYDVNMMLGDVDGEALIRLWKEGRCNWRDYRLEWMPSKWFKIKYRGKVTKVFEAFGFFQSSFVNALEKWGIGAEDELKAMKAARQNFTAKDKDRVIRYCLNECRLLVELMDELEIALDAVGLKVRSWIGAGAIASSLLSKNKVHTAHVHDIEYGNEIELALRNAYFGGRTELLQQGNFDRIWDYDISSAYPSEARELPSLTEGKWRATKEYEPGAKYALWEVSWNVEPESYVMPFPFRQGGSILYPSSGIGTYHANEVRAAIRIYGSKISVRRGWIYETDTRVRPFSFIDKVYIHRQRLKAAGHGGEKVLKLGMNAIYGKLAQGVGYRGQPPPFQSYFWAGMITAGTRARILDMAALDPESLVMVATDGIFFSKEVPIKLQPGLGGMELTLMDNVFIAQPGVYHATVDGESYGRSRGFFSREIDFDDLRRGFAEHGPEYVGKYNSHRFCGLGYSLQVRNFSNWRKWVDTDRKLSLYPSRKYLSEDLTNPIRHLPPHMEDDSVSEPYKPKTGLVELDAQEIDGMLSYIQGLDQPLRDY